MTAMEKSITTVIVDDHPFFRDGVSRGLQNGGPITIVGEASSGREAIELIEHTRPDVAIVDYQMPDGDGLDVVHAVIRDHLPTRVLLLSAASESAVVYRALEQGAAGYLTKDASRAEIVDAVRRVAKGGTVVPALLAGGLADQIRLRAHSTAPILADRESQVLKAFARGLSIPQLAKELCLAPSTIKTYTQRLYEKLGVSDRAAAVAVGIRQGLVD